MKRPWLFALLLSLATAGCVSIPPEAPELSAELGNRISAIEQANITLLHRFFDQKREKVDRFVEEEWVPAFAEEFFSNPTIATAWQTIVRENDTSERLRFIVTIGPKLQKKINEKRLELIAPLDKLERRIENTVREEYAQARAMNNSITSFLLSASEVAENRNRYLDMVGITEEKIDSAINKTDDAVNDLLKGTKDAEGKVKAAESFIDRIRSIRESI